MENSTPNSNTNSMANCTPKPAIVTFGMFTIYLMFIHSNGDNLDVNILLNQHMKYFAVCSITYLVYMAKLVMNTPPGLPKAKGMCTCSPVYCHEKEITVHPFNKTDFYWWRSEARIMCMPGHRLAKASDIYLNCKWFPDLFSKTRLIYLELTTNLEDLITSDLWLFWQSAPESSEMGSAWEFM